MEYTRNEEPVLEDQVVEDDHHTHVVQVPETPVIIDRDPPQRRLDRRDTSIDAARQGFGGLSFGAIVVGILVTEAALVLLATLAAIGVAALTTSASTDALAVTVVIATVAVLGVAYFFGGWASGRIARYSGAANGIAVAIGVLLLNAGMAGLTAWAVDASNIDLSWDTPDVIQRWQDVGSVEATSLIALAATLLFVIVASAFGGMVGQGYHRRADRLIADVASDAPTEDHLAR